MPHLLIPLLPLAAFVVIGLGCPLVPALRGRSHRVALPAIGISFLFSIFALVETLGGRVISGDLYLWVASGSFRVAIGYHLDILAAAMLVLVATVSGLVQLYSVSYMHGDRGYDRFLAYIGLFTFSMMMLVVSKNFLQLYVFWEAVGLCSYLLIAHWYERPAAAAAATKAFVVNRVGDFGFGLGILLIFLTFRSLEYGDVFAAAPTRAGETINLLGWAGGSLEVGLVTLIALLLFSGAIGKSAQVPLHTWLPDAMEGPTPISALIHAATMVTAGVFLVARLSPLFDLSPAALGTVAWVGGATALFAATIAVTQTDIKRVVAYSTVSQLGLMMMACGLQAYGAGIFHLLTHGAFKALLFLACGSVIHTLAGEQDLRAMGGLRKAMPVTYATFLVGGLALAGIPPFAGFFSKDEILLAAFDAGTPGRVLWAIGTLTTLLTGFYIFRIIFRIFHGPSRIAVNIHAHESGPLITVPLLILAALSVTVGWFGSPWPGSGGSSPHPTSAAGGFVAALSVGGAVAGIALAYLMHITRPGLAETAASRLAALHAASRRGWFVDDLYDRIFVRPTVRLAGWLWHAIDQGMIDAAVNNVAEATRGASLRLRAIQTGQLQHYALFMAAGALLIITFYFFAK